MDESSRRPINRRTLMVALTNVQALLIKIAVSSSDYTYRYVMLNIIQPRKKNRKTVTKQKHVA